MTIVDRSKFIGGSDVAAILGISPWKTPLQLWHDKTQPAMPENADPDRARVLSRGKRLEPYIVDMIRAEHGFTISAVNQRYVDVDVGYFACEIDAEGHPPGGQDGTENIEIKTVHPFRAKDWGEQHGDALPLHYLAQVQWGLGITDRPRCRVFALIGDDLRHYVVERDPEAIDGMREMARRFWVEHVETLVPPDPSTAGDMLRLFPRDDGEVIEADTEALIAYNELRALTEQAGEIEEKVERLRAALKRRIGGAATLAHQGQRLASWKAQAAQRFDQRAFAAAHPELFSSFLKSTETRIFRLA